MYMQRKEILIKIHCNIEIEESYLPVISLELLVYIRDMLVFYESFAIVINDTC